MTLTKSANTEWCYGRRVASSYNFAERHTLRKPIDHVLFRRTITETVLHDFSQK